MAHEELKALYEIDKQHSDKPGQYWELKTCNGKWVDAHEPAFVRTIEYRRKPDAPVWPDDKEDARKWRELMKQIEDSRNSINNSSCCYVEPEKPDLIQGYTREQWQRIIDEGFLCELSDDELFNPETRLIDHLSSFDGNEDRHFKDFSGLYFTHCRPLRIKGVRQPWFGGAECPVDKMTYVVATYKTGTSELQYAGCQHWPNVTEFIEL